MDIDLMTIKTDDEIRQWLWDHPKQENNSYATKVCRGCASIYSTPEGDARKAKIVSVCRYCIEIPE